MEPKRLFVIDGTALIFRSFYAFSGQTQLTSEGRNIGMVFGFLSSLFMLCKRENPDHLIITFDTSAPTFRHKMFPAYKAQRPPMDEDLAQQIPLLYELVDLLRIPQLSMEGWEADDIMGTLAVKGEKAGMDVYLVTGDKDFYQLVNDKVKVYTFGKRQAQPTVYDRDGVESKFGVPPENVIDVLGLMGDTSDNIPGVPKVGPKTAIDLIKRYGTLEKVLESAKEIKQPKLRQNLIEFADQARFSKELVIIEKNVPLEEGQEQVPFGPMNNPESRSRLKELEFRAILDTLNQIEPAEVKDKPTDKDHGAEHNKLYHTVTDPISLAGMVARMNKAELVSMDTETTSLDAMRAELVGLSFSIDNGKLIESWYVSAVHFEDVPNEFEPTPPSSLRPNSSHELVYILSVLKSFLTGDIPKTGQNLKYDMLVLSCYDIDVRSVTFDTLLASHLLDPTARQHNLDALAETHLGMTKIPTKELIGSGSKQISMADVELSQVSEYACEDTDVALRLTHIFQPKIAEAEMDKILCEQEIPLLPVLVRMEKAGVMLDFELLSQMSLQFQEEIVKLIESVHDLAGMPFNMNSTQQLAHILFDKLGLPPGRKTKLGYSTNINELERLAPLHELPMKLLRYRHLTKLKSTYIDSLPLLVHPITGRIHTSYQQAVAATGRLSSADPNLQNIPIRSEDGGRIRQAFIAGEPGWKIVAADYSQIELRIMAHLSGDSRMIEAFHSGQDIHSSTAAWMHDMPPELVTSDMRRQAKEVNFGVLYGMGEFGLSQRLNISRKRAKEFIEQYFANFPSVKGYIEEIHNFVREHGYVATMMGRRRPIPEISSKNFNVRQNAKRIATNTPIQGSAADLMKLAMIAVDRALIEENYKARMLMQVHDELVFEVPPDEVGRLSERLKELMGGVWDMKVPLEVSVEHGDNWLDSHG